MPKGMEYRRCEVAIAKVLRGPGKLPFDCPARRTAPSRWSNTLKTA